MTPDELIADDRAYFARWPDREFRLRRAHSSEYKFRDDPPPGKAAFVIVDKYEVEKPWLHRQFGCPLTLETDWSDARIKRFIADMGDRFL